VSEVLVVDDSAPIRTAVATALRVRGIKVETAVDGEDALRKLCAKTTAGAAYDGVILDIAMPRVNGWEVLLAIRSNPIWRDTRVIILTGVADEIADKVQAAEYDAILVEKGDDFVNAVQRLLGRVLACKES
jgi:CheY-like chemotaxis protein